MRVGYALLLPAFTVVISGLFTEREITDTGKYNSRRRGNVCLYLYHFDACTKRLGGAGKEGGWVGGAAAGPIQLYSDSTSALSLLNNNVVSARSKHIDVCYHVAREQVELGTVVFYCPTDKMKADMLTKPISTAKFALFRAGIGMERS